MTVKVISIVLFALLNGGADLAAYFYIKRTSKTAGMDTGEEKLPSKNISKRFFIISLLLALIVGAAIGTVIFDRTTSLVNFYRVAVILSITWAIAITDAKLGLIPNVLTLTLLVAGLVLHVIDLINSSFSKEALNQILIYYLAAAVVILIVLLILSATTHSGMGMGDIKYLATLCFAGGVMLLLTTLSVALLVSLLYGVAIMIIKKKKIRDTIPFGPFVLLGVVVCICTGLM